MADKKSFIVYKDWQRMVSKLSDQDAGQLFKALFGYLNDGEITELQPAADMAFTFMQQAFDRDSEKYEETCKRRSAAGKLGGRPRKQKVVEESKKSNSFSEKANKPDNDIDNDNVNDNENDIDIYIREKQPAKKTKRFVPPTIDEVAAYCADRHNGIDAEQFIDHYTSNGWLVGKNKMKDWKAAVRTWERNSVKVIPQKTTQRSGRNDWIDDVEL